MTLFQSLADRALATVDRLLAAARANPFRLAAGASVLTAVVAAAVVLAARQAVVAALAEACLGAASAR